MSDKLNVDGKSVRELAKLLDETGLSEVEYQVGTHRIRLVKAGISAPVTHVVAAPAPSFVSAPVVGPVAIPEAPPVPQGDVISSPMVGTAYLASDPASAPFVKVGSSVKKGDTLLIIEAMKVMNPIRAPRDGKVLEICVSDAKPVEFGESLIILE
jgi:acetyl-CoA carboxylase biotin carboxyl carrier protein